MSDEIKATNFGCCDSDCCDNDWLEWIIIIGVIFFLLCGGGNNLFGRRGCCR